MGHFRGHFGDGGVSDSVRVLGFDLDYLWLGNRASVAQPAILSPVGSALEDQVPTGYFEGPWNRGLFKFAATSDAWQGPFGDFSTDLLAILAFRAAAPIAAIANLISKREGFPDFVGWELFLDASGRVVGRADSDVSAAQTLGTPTDVATPGLPQMAGIRISPTLIEVATLLDYMSAAVLPGSFSTPASFSVGAGRLLTSTAIEIGFVGLALDRSSLRALDLQQDVLWPVAVELFQAQVEGSIVVDSLSRFTKAWK